SASLSMRRTASWIVWALSGDELHGVPHRRAVYCLACTRARKSSRAVITAFGTRLRLTMSGSRPNEMSNSYARLTDIELSRAHSTNALLMRDRGGSRVLEGT